MKYVALFENWQETFMERYSRALKLFDLGIIDAPLSPGSQVWDDFKQIVADELEERDYNIEDLLVPSDNRETLEISYTDQVKVGPPETKYLRYMITRKAGEPGVVYLLSAGYMKELSIRDPLFIIDEIIRLADKNLKPKY